LYIVVVASLDSISGDGQAAKAALNTRKTYIGLCWTDQHVELMKVHLRDWVLNEMKREGATYWNADYVRHLDTLARISRRVCFRMLVGKGVCPPGFHIIC